MESTMNARAAAAPTDARFIQLGDGLIGEMMTHQIQLFYDPTTEEVRAIFNGYVYLFTGNQFRRVGDENDILHVELKGMMGMTPVPPGTLTDPVTGADLSKISVAGVVMIIKAAYSYFFNQRALQRQSALDIQQLALEQQRAAENPPILALEDQSEPEA